MGAHKTVKGAYRYRYAPFLMPTYYVKGCSPLALPLGELSPQVTERVLQPFTEIPLGVVFRYGHCLPSPSSLRSATSPKGRGKGVERTRTAPSHAPQGAAPFRGSPQCVHWAMGAPESDAVQEGKDRTVCRQFFSPLAAPAPPQSRSRSPAPPKGEAYGG